MQENDRERWDKAAGEFQRVFDLGLSEYNAGLLRFWREEGLLRPGMRVIDVGCGVGKYGTYLAELGCDVTLTDISGEMLRLASENMAKYSTPWTVYRCDFNEITGREPVFAGNFDLAISTMSPAIHDTETVRKMSAMTRGWCFLARFSRWEQPLRDQLMSRIGWQPRRSFRDLEEDCAAMFRAVSEAGFVPKTRTVDYNWSDLRTPEQMADTLCSRCVPEDADAGEKRAEALKLARELADREGLIRDSVDTKVLWIWWNAGESAI